MKSNCLIKQYYSILLSIPIYFTHLLDLAFQTAYCLEYFVEYVLLPKTVIMFQPIGAIAILISTSA